MFWNFFSTFLFSRVHNFFHAFKVYIKGIRDLKKLSLKSDLFKMGKKTKLQDLNDQDMDELTNFEDLIAEKQVRRKKLKPTIEQEESSDMNEEIDEEYDDDDDEMNYNEESDEELIFDEDLDEEESNKDDIEDNEIEKEFEDMEDEEIDEEEFEDQESEVEDESDNFNRDLLKKIKINDKKISEWSRQLNDEPNKQVLTEIVTSLRVAVKCISGKSTSLRVEAANYFNPLLKLVLIDFLPAIHKLLKLDNKIEQDRTQLRTIRPKKSQYWKKYSAIIKVYLKTMLDIVDNFTDDTILSTLLKHILDLVPFYLCFAVQIKRILKTVSQLWSEGKEENRVLSFLILIRMLREQKSELISYIMKKLYISYIKNCKYTNEENFAMINFMKQSLVELYSLDQGIAYQHAFIYIRQCAINLRTSMMSNKKEGYKTVYNWQYVHSLLLWVQTISCLHPSDILKPLIFPLTQVLLGTIKLVPSSRYMPLRLHLVKALIKLSTSTNTFIPILPYLTEVLEMLERTKKYKSTTVENEEKIKNFNVILKVPNDFVNHSRFAELTIKHVHDLILEYTAQQSHLISFPELILVSNVRIRKFLKNWKNPNDCKQLKQLLDKIIESSKFIELKRKSSPIGVTEFDKVDAFENDMKLNGTPLMRFFESQKQKEDKQAPKQKPKAIESNNSKTKNFKSAKSAKSVENLKPTKNFKSFKNKKQFKNKTKKNRSA